MQGWFILDVYIARVTVDVPTTKMILRKYRKIKF